MKRSTVALPVRRSASMNRRTAATSCQSPTVYFNACIIRVILVASSVVNLADRVGDVNEGG